MTGCPSEERIAGGSGSPGGTTRLGRALLGMAVLALAFVFYLREFSRSPVDFAAIWPAADPLFLLLALLLNLLAYLVENVIWKVIIAAQNDGSRISFRELTAILLASGMFRYLPGRIWTVAAQLVMLKKYGISKALVIYINLICMLELVLVSLYLWLFYLAAYTSILSVPVIILLAAALVLANLLFTCCNKPVTDRLVAVAARFTRTTIQPIEITPSGMAVIQLIVAGSWALTGLSSYCLLRGVGLQPAFADLLPVTAALSMSWVAGYAAFFSPGGLGVREGVMLLLLKPVLTPSIALLLPVLSRILMLVSEFLLGMLAWVFCIRNNLFRGPRQGNDAPIQ